MEGKEKAFGHYVFRHCDPSATPMEKLEIVKWGIDRLIKELQPFDYIPNFDTLQFIIHETTRRKDSRQFFADPLSHEVVDEPIMTIAVKFNGTERGKHFLLPYAKLGEERTVNINQD